ncbi:MAG: glycosyltransferase family 1 protein [Solumvirus sp.]|uniref:Glycosyltransferase family 1 protein n=1 Tax=Solumvirus sp. TaxID=2487773 RepID=A0A3G5AJV8_9VIRU|nr:MAG: glycosyltransferase family 1 protein [Solumvirus sp.]
MSEFPILDAKLIDLCKQGNIKEAEKIGTLILNKAFNDPDDFGKQVKKHYARLEHNLSVVESAISAANQPKSMSAASVTDEKIISKIDQKDEIVKSSIKRIAIFSIHGDGALDWEPGNAQSLQQLMLIRLAKDLALVNNIDTPQVSITVFAKPPKQSFYSLPLANPRFYHENEASGAFDVVIGWNRTDVVNLSKYAIGSSSMVKKVYCYFTDPTSTTLSDEDIKIVKGIFYLSEAHRSILANKTPALLNVPYITGVNIDSMFDNVNIINERKKICVYPGLWNNSLQIMLMIWPYIQEKVKDAKLLIIDQGHEMSRAGTNYNKIVHKIKSLKSLGVSLVDSKNDLQRRDTFKKASLVCFPLVERGLVFSEMLIQAQACGCIPVISDINLTEHIPKGDISHQDYIVSTDHEDLSVFCALFVEKVVKILSEKELLTRRIDIVKFIKQFAWEKLGLKFYNFIKSQSEKLT